MKKYIVILIAILFAQTETAFAQNGHTYNMVIPSTLADADRPQSLDEFLTVVENHAGTSGPVYYKGNVLLRISAQEWLNQTAYAYNHNKGVTVLDATKPAEMVAYMRKHFSIKDYAFSADAKYLALVPTTNEVAWYDTIALIRTTVVDETSTPAWVWKCGQPALITPNDGTAEPGGWRDTIYREKVIIEKEYIDNGGDTYIYNNSYAESYGGAYSEPGYAYYPQQSYGCYGCYDYGFSFNWSWGGYYDYGCNSCGYRQPTYNQPATTIYEGDTYIDNSVYQDNDTWVYQDNDNTNIDIDQTQVVIPATPVTPDPKPETPVYPVTPDPVVVNDPPSGENGGNGYNDPPSGQNGTAYNPGEGYNDPNSGDNGGEGFNDPPSGSGKWEGDGNAYTYAPANQLASNDAKLVSNNATFAPVTAKANDMQMLQAKVNNGLTPANQQLAEKRAVVSKDNQFFSPSNSANGKVGQPNTFEQKAGYNQPNQKYESKSVPPAKVNTDDKFAPNTVPVKQQNVVADNYKPAPGYQPGNYGKGSSPVGDAYKPVSGRKYPSESQQQNVPKQNYNSAPKQQYTPPKQQAAYTPQKSNPAPKGGYQNVQPKQNYNAAPRQQQQKAPVQPQRNFQQKAPQGPPPSFKGGGKKG